jgi:methionine-rich copper-binding protein CopC
VAVTGAALFGAAPAGAHDRITSTTPRDGERVTAPASVDLAFTEDVVTLGTAVRVQGPSGVVSRGAPVVRGREVTQALAPGLVSGSYAVAWRVTSADGHPVSGTFAFTVVASPSAETGPGTPSTVPAPPVADDAASGPVATAVASPTPTDNAAAVPWWVVLIVVLALGVGTAAVWRWPRRRARVREP